jgi:protein NrfD
VDLGRPQRFWHMMIQSNTFRPMFKYWSPMSIGSWALLIFGLFTFASFLGSLAEDDRIRWPALRAVATRWPAFRTLRAPSPQGRIISVIGAFLGLYVAGYTGVLLAVTNRPIWSDTPLLGMLFVVSAGSTSAALLLLLARRAGGAPAALADLRRFDDWMIALEFLTLIALMLSLGPVLRAWLSAWGVLLSIAIVVGLIAPLALSWRARSVQRVNVLIGPILVLLGGFLLRLVIVFSAQAV